MYLSGMRKIEVPEKRRDGNGKFVEIKGASENNLKNIDVKIPLGKMVCVTGVSGSGKSSLINEILYKAVAAEMYGSREKPGKCKKIKGIENIDKIIDINQSPIGENSEIKSRHIYGSIHSYTGSFREASGGQAERLRQGKIQLLT